MNALVLFAGGPAKIVQHVHVTDTGFVFDFGKVEVRRGDRAVHVEDDAAQCHVNRAAINPNSQANATLYTSWTSFLTFSTNSGGMSLYPWSFWACSRTFFMSSSIVSACATKSQATPASRQRTSFIGALLLLLLAHSHSRCAQRIQRNRTIGLQSPKRKRAGWAFLHTRAAPDAFGILHRQAFVREVHDVNTLMADGRADITRNAFRFLREDTEPRESRVDVHQRRQRTGEPAPHAPAEPEIHPDANDAREEHVDDVIVVQLDAEH